MKPLDLSLYLVVHRGQHSIEKLIDIVLQAIEGATIGANSEKKKPPQKNWRNWPGCAAQAAQAFRCAAHHQRPCGCCPSDTGGWCACRPIGYRFQIS